jgi:hypothetical protein
MNKETRLSLIVGLFIVISYHFSRCLAQGSLTPPGAPAPTMKSIAQIEPRTPISSVPYIINDSGSYYLTTNLTGVASQYGIAVLADNVTIDLNGFTLSGVDSSFTGIGFFGQKNLCVRNGVIRAWPQGGIGAFPSTNCRFEDLLVTENSLQSGGGGIVADANSLVIRCGAYSNGFAGISVGRDSTVRECNASFNFFGITAGDASVLAECTALTNSNGGISVGNGAVISDCIASFTPAGSGFAAGSACKLSGCTAVSNSQHGFNLADGNALRDCIARASGKHGINAGASTVLVELTAAANLSNGITTGDGCTIQSCNSFGNQGDGVHAGSACTVTGCTTRSNRLNGIFVSGHALVTENLCDQSGVTNQNSTCIKAINGQNRIDSNHVMVGAGFHISVGNTDLMVRNSVDQNGFAVISGPMFGPFLFKGNDTDAQGMITNNNPWANFLLNVH